MSDKKSFKRNLTEWLIMIIIGGTLYLTGYHTEVIGRMQQIMLWTGIMTPDINSTPENRTPVNLNFRLIDLAGNRINVADLKGKVIFINFWATWCPPCVAEMPDIHKLYKKTANEDIVFLMISVDERQEEIRKFLQRKKFTFPVYRLISPLPPELHSSTVPTTFVIDRAGNIAAKRKGAAKYTGESFRDFLFQLTQEKRVNTI